VCAYLFANFLDCACSWRRVDAFCGLVIITEIILRAVPRACDGGHVWLRSVL